MASTLLGKGIVRRTVVGVRPKTAATLLTSLHENLKHPNEDIQRAAVGGLAAFLGQYFPAGVGDTPEAGIRDTVAVYVAPVLKGDPNAAIRRGFGLALGVLPPALLRACTAEQLQGVCDALCKGMEVEAKADERDAEARRNAVEGIHGFTVACLHIHDSLATLGVLIGGDGDNGQHLGATR